MGFRVWGLNTLYDDVVSLTLINQVCTRIALGFGIWGLGFGVGGWGLGVGGCRFGDSNMGWLQLVGSIKS